MDKNTWKALFVLFFNLAFFGLLIYAFNSPAPTPCNGPDGHREDCLDKQEWEEYCYKMKDRKQFRWMKWCESFL